MRSATTAKTRRAGRRAGSLVSVAGTVVAAVLSLPAPAEAAGSYIGSNSGGANVRSCASTGCSSYGYLSNGTGVTMYCWLDSQWVYPPSSDYASPRWFRVGSPVGTGYVHSSLVENQRSVGHC